MTARDHGFVARLKQLVRGEVREAELLARYSTYRIGGPATVVLAADPADVEAALAVVRDFGASCLVLGLGSNMLLPDDGLDALVIRMGKGIDRIDSDGAIWRLGAGLPAPLAARKTAGAGWGGLHKMVGVPGSVGGGVFMNAGCHGASWSDVVRSVTVALAGGGIEVRPRHDLQFAYRQSGLEGAVVLETEVELHAESAARLTEEVNDLFRWRQEGTPFNRPCCGSVFQNPAQAPAGADGRPMTAGRLIEAAGLKGYRAGGAEVSTLHGNYIINTGGATAADVRRAIDEVRATVLTRFGVRLETEVKLIRADGTALPASGHPGH
ncbi:MAG: UDP-N-acetylmuramate dehydrogenase [Gemmatimonadota bacterium]